LTEPKRKLTDVLKDSSVLDELLGAVVSVVASKVTTEHTMRNSGEEIMKDPDVLKDLDERIKRAQQEGNQPLIDQLNKSLTQLNQRIDQVAATVDQSKSTAETNRSPTRETDLQKRIRELEEEVRQAKEQAAVQSNDKPVEKKEEKPTGKKSSLLRRLFDPNDPSLGEWD
jgi:phage shock protein A